MNLREFAKATGKTVQQAFDLCEKYDALYDGLNVDTDKLTDEFDKEIIEQLKMMGQEVFDLTGIVGIIRKLDHLGRVTIPKEYRDYLGWEHGDKIQILLTENNEIIVKRVKEVK